MLSKLVKPVFPEECYKTFGKPVANRPNGPGRKDKVCANCHHAMATKNDDAAKVQQYQLCTAERDGLDDCEYEECLDYRTCHTKIYAEKCT